MLIVRIVEDEYSTKKLLISRPLKMNKYIGLIKDKLSVNNNAFIQGFVDKVLRIITEYGLDLNEEYNTLYKNECSCFDTYLYKIKLLSKDIISKITSHSKNNHIFEVDLASEVYYFEECLFSKNCSLVENLNKGLVDIND